MFKWKEIRTEEKYFESSGETNINSIAKDVVDDIIKGYNEGWVLFVPRCYGCPQTLYIECYLQLNHFLINHYKNGDK